ncbi:LysE family translocator [Brevibacillus choshinensis]|uniref:LysE family translocator n=1 Tax=Brevibacillus choshinensis TaxID=54911 RepID=UPI002E2349DB|nr:LysE family translocator [Brevibacillus choshinensis]MED4780491.1 LysE family translocator [Brevibacillus choshinensis]
MIENFGTFIIVALLLIIAPGADMAMVTKNTLLYGRKGGINTALGITIGTLVHMVAAAVGISAIIAKSAELYSVLKIVGALYLVYLGIQSLLAMRHFHVLPDKMPEREKNEQVRSAFFQGVLSNVLNPKMSLFFLTFLPQFISIGRSETIQIITLGLTYATLGIIWLTLYTFIVRFASSFFRSERTQKLFNGLTGTVLIGLGIKLALDRK